ncbi:MAG: response regulator transcription factor [Alphaproteobacteria bacterium]|nr:response regulator transcription factor [Alphaproteobacteria bacterium]MCB9931601.1 response regulator transcription factor [Alphaproteobacteria bacterium]
MQDEAAHIFVVDDDRRLANLLCRYLTNAGYLALAAHDSADARAKLASLSFDLVVLDIMMPGESGLVLAEELAQDPNGPPVLLITALDAPGDRVRGLTTGAEDYIAKPFDPRELLLRIERTLRRREPAGEAPRPPAAQEPERLALGDLVFEVATGLLTQDGKRVLLTPQEQRLLRYLAGRLGDEVSRDDLADALGDGTTWRAVDVQVARLRKKMEADPRNPSWLQTVRGVGYRLAGRPLA